MIQIDPYHLKILLDIITTYPYQFYVYGSRAKNTASRYSDLDICIKGSAPQLVLAELREKFEESSIPFKIDLVPYEHMDAAFRALVEKDFIELRAEAGTIVGQ